MRRWKILIIAAALLLLTVSGKGQDFANTVNQTKLANDDTVEISLPLKDALAILSREHRVHILYEDSLIANRVVKLPQRFSDDFYRDLYQLLKQHPVWFHKIGKRSIVLTYQPVDFMNPSAFLGAIQGRIVDLEGTGIPVAQVLIEGTPFGAAADVDGRFTLSAIPPGTYTVSTRVIGYRDQKKRIIIKPAESATIDFSLTPDVLNMNEIVVTGTRNPLTKIESSVAITTANNEQIAARVPRSTADLLKVIPGFYVESSGGESGNNLFSRGLPADGSFRYVAVYEDGLPVFEAPELAFANIDVLIRVDETVAVLEGVRGSTGSIFASNAPAGIINFISKTGGVVPSGTIKITTANHGLFRTDLGFGGPLGEQWRFHVGGFYRYDRGIRDPGFAANHGGQVKANITRILDNGSIRFYGKFLDDRSIFYLPIPLRDAERPSGIRGFDPSTGTLASADVDFIKVPTPDGTSLEFDLQDGIHPRVGSVVAEVLLQLGDDWTLKNSARVMAASLQFNAIFSVFNPVAARVFAQSRLDGTAGASGYRYRYTHYPNERFDPVFANGNGLVVETGWWAVSKPLRNFTNHLQLTIKPGSHAVTGGLYVSDYSANDFWYWQNVLMEVRSQPRLLDLILLDKEGQESVSVAKAGFTKFGSAYVNSTNHGLTVAYYLNDEWQASGKLRIDSGVRFEHSKLNGTRENLGEFDLGDTTTLADDQVIFGNGTFRPYAFSYAAWALSFGSNFRINREMALYARASKGFRMPDFDQFISVNPASNSELDKGEIEHVRQMEGGIKIATPRYALFGAFFLIDLDNIPFSDEVIDPISGKLTTVRRFANSTTYGVEIEAMYAPLKGLELGLIATFQNPRMRNFTFNIAGQPMSFDGNRVRRIPQALADFTAAYSISRFQVLANIRYIGERFVDDANNVSLPAYVELHTGLSYHLPNVTLTFSATNLLNTIGLTEANPRIGQIIGRKEELYMARPILGRAFTLSAAYSF